MNLKIALRLPILSLVFLCSFTKGIAQKSHRKNHSYQWFPFKWYGDTLNGKYFDKLAILLPVKINNLKGNFVTQFDLGSDASMVYGNSIRNYFGDSDAVYRLLDTSKKVYSDAGMRSYPKNEIKLKLGNYQVKNVLYAEFGDETPMDSMYTTSDKLVGTIGANITFGKVLKIDFPNRKMCLLDTIDKYWSDKAWFVDCRVRNSRIQLPITVNGEIKWFLFDTGSSLFAADIDKAEWGNLVDKTQTPDTLEVNSWGEKVKYYGAAIGTNVFLGKYRLPGEKAWYTENKRLNDFNKVEEITGTIGNAWFFNNVVVIDFRNMRFGIVKN